MAVSSFVFNLSTVIFLLVLVDINKSFNLSPKPNIVLREPNFELNIGRPKVRSSYFGFSLNLKRNRYLMHTIYKLN